jgi:hypothetical protein
VLCARVGGRVSRVAQIHATTLAEERGRSTALATAAASEASEQQRELVHVIHDLRAELLQAQHNGMSHQHDAIAAKADVDGVRRQLLATTSTVGTLRAAHQHCEQQLTETRTLLIAAEQVSARTLGHCHRSALTRASQRCAAAAARADQLERQALNETQLLRVRASTHVVCRSLLRGLAERLGAQCSAARAHTRARATGTTHALNAIALTCAHRLTRRACTHSSLNSQRRYAYVRRVCDDAGCALACAMRHVAETCDRRRPRAATCGSNADSAGIEGNDD